MINPAKLFKIKGAWERFAANHPKFPKFMEAVGKTALEEGTIFEFNVTTAAGANLTSNIKLTREDIELFKEMSELFKS
jgi:hypothetical protein